MEQLAVLDYSDNSVTIIDGIPNDVDMDDVLRKFGFKPSQVMTMYGPNMTISFKHYTDNSND